MESSGAKALDFKKSKLKQGDVIIMPLNNTNVKLLSGKLFHLVRKRQLMPCRWLGTMSRKNGACFYCNLYGPLPFSIGNIDPEEYLIYLVGNFKRPDEAIKHF